MIKPIIVCLVFLAVLALVKFRRQVLGLFRKFWGKIRSWTHEETLHDIRVSLGIEISGLHFPGTTHVKKTDPDTVYYCNVCYVTSEKPGRCLRHGFANPFTKGSRRKLDFYHKENRFYEADNNGDLEEQ
jgi:hypothetical protein